jgi:hypothetical protein
MGARLFFSRRLGYIAAGCSALVSVRIGDVMMQTTAGDINTPSSGRARAFRKRTSRAAGSDAHVGILFWLTILFLGGFSLGCVALGMSRPEALAEVEKRLHAERLFPKLYTEKSENPAPIGEPVPTEPPQPQTELPQEKSNTPVSPIVEVAPVLQRVIAEPQATPAVSAASSDPMIYLPRPEPTFGESPMNRTWKTLALASLLVAASPTFATAGGEPDAKALQKTIEELRKTVESLSTKVDKAALAMSSKEVLAEINRLEKTLVGQIDKASKDLQLQITTINEEQLRQKLDLQGLKSLSKRVQALEENVVTINEDLKKLRKQILAESPIPTQPADRAAFDDIRARLAKMEKLLESLQTSGIGSSERKSFASPAGANFGRVLLVNLYSEDMLFIVNDRPYRVDSGKTVQLDGVPTGALNYHVFSDRWGTRALKTTSLQPSETLTVTAR